MLLGRHRTTGQYGAIKALRKDLILKRDECNAVKAELAVFEIATKAKHPCLVHLVGAQETSTHFFFVMEYVGGGDLMFHVQRRKFSLREAREYSGQVLLALEFLHSQGILYR